MALSDDTAPPQYIVIICKGGILDAATLYQDREQALREGHAAWGWNRQLGPGAEGEEIDPKWHGVARTCVMHWFDDDDDVWVVQV